MDDGTIRQAGEQIELPDDVAALHATQLQLVAKATAPAAPDASSG
jgi:hypothetical protein